jgi:hypothetical protein
VRSLRCYELGLALRGVTPPPVVHPLSADPTSAVLFEFLVAAVCHATNWDRLRSVMSEVAMRDGLSADVLSSLSFDGFVAAFGDAFPDKMDLRKRHEMLTSVASDFVNSPVNGPESFGFFDGAVELSGATGLYRKLDRFPVFAEDPQRKKSRILVQQLYRHRLVQFVDPENVSPATEYHLIRLYLRTERVVHSEGLEFATEDSRAIDLRSITALRSAVEQAMRYTASGAEMPLPDVNEIEWQIARSFCVREAPRCAGPPRADKPVDEAILGIADGACPFINSCNGARIDKISRLSEPRLSDRYAFY